MKPHTVLAAVAVLTLSAEVYAQGRRQNTLASDVAVRKRRLLAWAGRFGDLAWAPDGRWLLAAWRDADQWVFIRTGTASRAAIERLRAVANISSQFHPGAAAAPTFPGLAGWCCAP